MELTNVQMNLLPDMVEYFNRYATSKENSVGSKEIIKFMIEQHNVKLNPQGIRAMIHFIRTTWMIKNLVACRKGYFIAQNKSEVQEYIDTLRERIQGEQIIIDSFEDDNFLDEGKEYKIKTILNDDW